MLEIAYRCNTGYISNKAGSKLHKLQTILFQDIIQIINTKHNNLMAETCEIYI
jgi:hypothetical protein